MWNFPVCLITHSDVWRQTRLKERFGSGGRILKRCYHTKKQVSVCSPPTLIDFQDKSWTTLHCWRLDTLHKKEQNDTCVCVCVSRGAGEGVGFVKWFERLSGDRSGPHNSQCMKMRTSGCLLIQRSVFVFMFEILETETVPAPMRRQPFLPSRP